MNIKTTLKTSVAAAALFAVAVPVAEAGNVQNGNGNSLTISGHLNKAVLYMDNGENARTTIVDSEESSSRVRLVGKGQINEAWSVGTNFEMELQSNGGNNVSPIGGATNAPGDSGTGQTTLTERHTDISFSHKQFGKFSIGQGSAAGDGGAYSDLSGTGLAISSGMTFDGLGSNLNVSGSAKGASSTLTVGAFFTSHDGARTDRVRYDTPTFGGFSAAASAAAGGDSEFAAFYGGKFGGVEVSAAAGYVIAGGTNDNTWIVSAAAKHDSGLNVWGAYGETEADTGGVDDSHYHIGLGYSANLVAAGSTNFGVAYYNAEDVGNRGDELEGIHVGVVQNVTDAGTELYASYSNWDVERTGTNFDDVTAVKVGARVKF